MTRAMTREEGLFVGGSGGAAVAGAIKWAKTFGPRALASRGKGAGPIKILVFLCDAGQKYVSKIFNDDWMRENGFLDEAPGIGTVADILHLRNKRKIVTTTSSAKVKDVISTLKELGISQLPVVDKGKLKGIISEVDLLRHMVSGPKTASSSIAPLLESDYATVTPDTKIELLQGVLADARAAIVTDRDSVVGIVTKIDLIEYLAKKSTEAPAAKAKPAKKKSAKKTNGARERRA